MEQHTSRHQKSNVSISFPKPSHSCGMLILMKRSCPFRSRWTSATVA